ncbi:UvrD-helicase domain-containing protein [Blautia marasmi]|uniref:UvrD-helicase domain-containing protein n=1 Tax=Blautia marasmi TaxID=1917868 RepID=UPI00266CE581|nr:UvrD-helicase domain-containing protein [Blautia marasmi]
MYIADLHIHSRYSRATSRDCTPEYLDLWARRKGIQIVGTGDFTHPAWREELREKLEPAEDGLYVLKEGYRIQDSTAAAAMQPRFVVTGEISSIYKKKDKVRKVHSLILLPGLEDAEIISGKLESIGNIHSDGRPILGLDCRDLLEILLELCPRAVYVPAHIWTPHFSLFGAFSGFDSVKECFDDLSPYIRAMETGLSSDPPMNWRISALDKYQLISNSDAHSPAKLGREANLLDIELTYEALRNAIQEGVGLAGTIEFFPEEGKYHFDGHRKCHLCLSPPEAEKYQGKCPVCGRKLTIGVSHRVEQLADRPEGFLRADGKAFESLVPLPEVIGASVGYSAASRKVVRQYEEMLRKLGPEFEILRIIPLEEIRSVSGHLITEGIRRLREGKVERIPGFDGEYGTIKLFKQTEIENLDGQMSLFDGMENIRDTKEISGNTGTIQENGLSDNALKSRKGQTISKPVDGPAPQPLNPQQQKAVRSIDRAVAVIAGPGTGKTKTLISRILYLLETRKVKPSEITAVTFTNKAAAEMQERLGQQLGKGRSARLIQVGTFHSICLDLLKKQGMQFTLADETETLDMAADIVKSRNLGLKPRQFLQKVSLIKTNSDVVTENDFPDFPDVTPFAVLGITKPEYAAYIEYRQTLRALHILDFDDLLTETLNLIKTDPTIPPQSFNYLHVDEFQDISPIQYRLIMEWTKRGRELFVIGDPDQSIYGFRGSDDKCFEHLKNDFSDLNIIRLTENYRSTPQVISGAVKVISKNPGMERVLHPNRPDDNTQVRLVTAGSEMGEAIFTAKEINRLIGGIDMLDAQEKQETRAEHKTRSFADIAVLYRTHRQAELLEKCLRREGIPYVIAGREDFLAEKTVRGCICFFRCLADQGDTVNRDLCLKLLWDLEPNRISGSIFETMQEKYIPFLKKGKPQKVLEQWIEDMNLTDDIAVNKFLGMTVFYKSMQEFMDAVCLGVESDLKRCGGRQYTADCVTLMTLHGSKGLEFPVTIIYGVRKGVIPFERDSHLKKEDSAGIREEFITDMEEERRLFYVGMTRAKEELILTTSREASVFLEDLPEESLLRESADKRKQNDGGEQLNLFDFL